jgi:hypothetical protein
MVLNLWSNEASRSNGTALFLSSDENAKEDLR